jgi:polar amino acid transport system substrate-binding protein
LINKAIDSITKEEKNKINERWIQIHHSKKISSIYFYILLATASLVVLFFAIWLFLLKREIIKKNQKEKELKKIISIDSLTNIFNRYMLDNTLNKEILLAERYDAPLSIIFFDIDGFKNINDTYGHKVGDYILKEFSKVIVNSIRKSDVFGRWGGDEFLIILVNTKEEYAKIFAKNLEVKIAKHHFVEHIPLRCTFGVASYQKNDTPVDIIKRVDENFYKEKNLKSKIESEY